MVRHPEALGGHLSHVPPGPQLVVGVDPVEQGLEAPVAASWRPNLRLLDRRRGRAAALVRTGGALCFPGAVSAHERSVPGPHARTARCTRVGSSRVWPGEYRRGRDASILRRLRELPWAPPGGCPSTGRLAAGPRASWCPNAPVRHATWH